MARRVLIRPQAVREIDAQAAYLVRQASPAVARRFHAALREAFDRLAALPDLGAPWESENPRLAGIRTYPVPGFRRRLLFSRAAEEAVEILHLFHGARDVESHLDDPE